MINALFNFIPNLQSINVTGNTDAHLKYTPGIDRFKPSDCRKCFPAENSKRKLMINKWLKYLLFIGESTLLR
jgi:hypothetical protein